MRLTTSLLFVCLFLLDATFINCWESYELDLFDLVEEVGQNFYEYFGLTQVIYSAFSFQMFFNFYFTEIYIFFYFQKKIKQSDSNDIKKAYRKLSLVWHPDKNDDPDAEKKFRNVIEFF